ADGLRIDNVATRASFVAAFLAGREGEAMRLAQDRRKSADSVAGTKDEDAVKGKGPGVARRAGCGVIGDQEGQSTTLAALVVALGIAVTPPLFTAAAAAVMVRRRRRDV